MTTLKQMYFNYLNSLYPYSPCSASDIAIFIQMRYNQFSRKQATQIARIFYSWLSSGYYPIIKKEV